MAKILNFKYCLKIWYPNKLNSYQWIETKLSMMNKLSLRVSTKSTVTEVKLLTSKAGYLNAKSASNKHKARRQIIKNVAIYKVTGRTRQKTREYISVEADPVLGRGGEQVLSARDK
jgi:prenyltransferase beta subunit